MKLIKGFLHYHEPWTLPDIYLFTGNATIKRNGALVMGRGAAKEVRDTFPNIDKTFGVVIPHTTQNIVWLSLPNRQQLGWFKVKEHWADTASLVLIKESVRQLVHFAEKYPQFKFHLNYPGVGAGSLHEKDVEELLKPLPDNVFIYR